MATRAADRVDRSLFVRVARPFEAVDAGAPRFARSCASCRTPHSGHHPQPARTSHRTRRRREPARHRAPSPARDSSLDPTGMSRLIELARPGPGRTRPTHLPCPDTARTAGSSAWTQRRTSLIRWSGVRIPPGAPNSWHRGSPVSTNRRVGRAASRSAADHRARHAAPTRPDDHLNAAVRPTTSRGGAVSCQAGNLPAVPPGAPRHTVLRGEWNTALLRSRSRSSTSGSRGGSRRGTHGGRSSVG